MLYDPSPFFRGLPNIGGCEMTWNHRIIKHVQPNGEPYLAIHEVIYDKVGNPTSYTLEPTPVIGEGVENLIWTLNRMRACLKDPILDKSDLPDLDQT